jgi:hypothetical protein
MSKAISTLLDQPEPVIKRAVKILEDKNGSPSHDVRQLAQNIQAIRIKIADLGLDANDTTAEELYHALLIKYQNDSQTFDNNYSPILQTQDQKADNAAKLISRSGSLPEVWSLKPASAKNLLKSLPPKKIMKHLGYRSVDSLLKRQNLAEIHLMLGRFESSTWNRAHSKKISSLDSSNFELGPLKIASPSSAKWGDVSSDTAVGFDANFGVLGILPSSDRMDPPLLSIVILLADALSGFDDGTAGARLAQISPIVAWWKDMDGLVANLNGQCVSLNIIDAAANHSAANQFADQRLDSGRQSFWQSLVSRYDNLLTAEEDLKMSFKYRPLVINAPVNQPALEYVEDI